jgi:hypothetical protein
MLRKFYYTSTNNTTAVTDAIHTDFVMVREVVHSLLGGTSESQIAVHALDSLVLDSVHFFYMQL